MTSALPSRIAPPLNLSAAPLRHRLRTQATRASVLAVFPAVTTAALMELTAMAGGGQAFTGVDFVVVGALGFAAGATAAALALSARSARLRALPGYRALSRSAAVDLYETVDRIAARIGVPAPKIAALDQDGRNAFVFGATRRSATLVVSLGLLEALDRNEFEAVVAHELAHVKAGDAELIAAFGACLEAATRIDAGLRLLLRPLARRLPAIGLRMGVGAGLARGATAAFRWLLPQGRDFVADHLAAAASGTPAALYRAMGKIADAPLLTGTDALVTASLFDDGGAAPPTLETRLRLLFADAAREAAAPVSAGRTPPAFARLHAMGAALRAGLGSRIAVPLGAAATAAVALTAGVGVLLRTPEVNGEGPATASIARPAAPAAAVETPAPAFAAAPTASPHAPKPVANVPAAAANAAQEATGSLPSARPALRPTTSPVAPGHPVARKPDAERPSAAPKVATRAPASGATPRALEKTSGVPQPPRRPGAL